MHDGYNMDQPIMSIVIPVYNHQEALVKALWSIAEQTYRPIEVIVVDDGSDSPVHLPPYQGGHGGSVAKQIGEKITLIREEHLGAPAARNRGFKESTGEYVIFWDADTVGVPSMLEKMKRALDKHPEASYAYCNFQYSIFPVASGTPPSGGGNFQKKMRGRPFDPNELRKNNYIHSTSLIRRRDAVPWDESLKRFQDWDLWLTMVEQGKRGVWVPKNLFFVASRKDGISFWLPSFAYHLPWRWLPGVRQKARIYEEARRVVMKKHQIKYPD